MKQLDTIKNNAWVPTVEDLKLMTKVISALPAASASTLGETYILNGVQTGYSRSHVYHCELHDGKYVWQDLNVGTYGVGNVTNFTLYTMTKDDATYAYLKWNDPEDLIVNETTLAKWTKSIVVRKQGSEPTSSTDGTIIEVITERNKYATSNLKTLVPDATLQYFYKIFPCSTDNVITNNNVNCRNTESNFVVTADRVPMAGKTYYMIAGTESTQTYVEADLGGAFKDAAVGKIYTRRYNAVTGVYVYTPITSDTVWDKNEVYYFKDSSMTYYAVVDYSLSKIDNKDGYLVKNYFDVPAWRASTTFDNYYEKRVAAINWQTIKRVVQEGQAQDYFQVGDLITLPWHGDYGYMQWEVVGFNQAQIKGDEDGAQFSPSMTLQQKHLYYPQNRKGAVANSYTCVFNPVEKDAVITDDTVFQDKAPYFVQVGTEDKQVYAEAAVGRYNVDDDAADAIAGKRRSTSAGQPLAAISERFWNCDLPWKNPGTHESTGTTNTANYTNAGTCWFYGAGKEGAGWDFATGILEEPSQTNGTWSSIWSNEQYNCVPRATTSQTGSDGRCYFYNAASRRSATSGSYDLSDYVYNPYVRYFSNDKVEISHVCTAGNGVSTVGVSIDGNTWSGMQGMGANHFKKWYVTEVTARMYAAYKELVAAGTTSPTLAQVAAKVQVPVLDDVFRKNKSYSVKIGADARGWPVTVPVWDGLSESPLSNAFEDGISGKPAKVPTADLVEYKDRKYFTATADTTDGNPYKLNFHPLAHTDDGADYRVVQRHYKAKTGVKYYRKSGDTFVEATDITAGDNVMPILNRIDIDISKTCNVGNDTNYRDATDKTGGDKKRGYISIRFFDPLHTSNFYTGQYYLESKTGTTPAYVTNATLPFNPTNGSGNIFPFTDNAAAWKALQYPTLTNWSSTPSWNDPTCLGGLRTTFLYIYTLNKVSVSAGANPKSLGLYEKIGADFRSFHLTADTSVTSGKDYYEKVLVDEQRPVLKKPKQFVKQTNGMFRFEYDEHDGYFYETSDLYMRKLGTDVWENVAADRTVLRTFTSTKAETPLTTNFNNGTLNFLPARYDAVNNGSDYLSKLRYAETMPDLTGFDVTANETLIYTDAPIFWHVPNLERNLYGNNTWAGSYARKYLNGPLGTITRDPDTKHCTQSGSGEAMGYKATLNGREVDIDKSFGAPTTWWQASTVWDNGIENSTANSKSSLQSFLRGFLDCQFKPVSKQSENVNWATTNSPNGGVTAKVAGTWYWYNYGSDEYVAMSRVAGETLRLKEQDTNAWWSGNGSIVPSNGSQAKVAYELNPTYEEDILEAYHFLNAIAIVVNHNNTYGTTSTDYYNEYGLGTITYDKVYLASCYQMNAGNQSTNGVIEDTAVLTKYVGCQNADRIKRTATNSMYDGSNYVATGGAYWWLRTAGGSPKSGFDSRFPHRAHVANDGLNMEYNLFGAPTHDGHNRGLSPLITIA